MNGLSGGSYKVTISGGDLGWSDTVTVQRSKTLDLGDIALHPELPFP